MIKWITFILILFLLLVVPVTAKIEIHIVENEVIFGEIIKRNTTIVFPKLDDPKPIFYVLKNSYNVKVHSSHGEEVNYTRYSKSDYAGLQEYLRTYCEPDEEGFLPVDSGYIITFEDGTSIESYGGYCIDYEKIVPDDEVDILLIDYEGLTIPLVYFSVSYDTPQNPSQNWYCDDTVLPFPVTEYRLPKGAYIWNTTKELNEEENNGYVNFTVMHNEGAFKRVCFSYGTKSEYEDYDSRKNTFFGYFIALSTFLVALFVSIFYAITSSHRRINWVIHILFLFTLTIFGYVFYRYIPFYFNIIPQPFLYDYQHLIFVTFIISIVIYFLCIFIFWFSFTRCSFCSKYIRKQGLSRHITMMHNKKITHR